MSIKILTDSGSDYEKNEIEEKNIDVIPIPISFKGNDYLSGIDLNKDEFFELLESEEDFPKTAQPSPQIFIDYFENAKKNGDEVIAIMLSGSLSGMLQTMHLCKKTVGYDKIHIIDSVSATVGIRLLVDNAVKLRTEGKSVEEIVTETEELKKRIRLYATFPTLKYLVKGGRLSRFEASAATLARIKPVITINPVGEVLVCHKGVGIKRSIDYMAQAFIDERPDINYPIFPIYSGDPSNCRIMLEKISEKGFNISDRKITNIGPTIGTYVGIGAAGIVFIKSK